MPKTKGIQTQMNTKTLSQIIGALLLAAACHAQPDTPNPAVTNFPEELVLIFQDEFEGDGLNPDLWRSLANARSAGSGRYPSSSALARTRSRVSSEISRRPRNAIDTAGTLNPSALAMSFRVTR